MPFFGVHTLPGHGDVEAAVRVMRPAAVLVLDDLALAKSLKTAYPEMEVIFRPWAANDGSYANDPTFDVVEWVNTWRKAGVGEAGLILQLGNEPDGYSDPAPPVSMTLKAIAAAGTELRLGVMAWGVGHPSEAYVDAGRYDPILKALIGTRHVALFHEYAVASPLAEPFRVGRCKRLIDRADHFGGLKREQVIVSEAGRDVGGGINDGWRAAMGWEAYIGFLWEYARAYEALGLFGRVLAVLPFGFGPGGGDRWASFNVDMPEITEWLSEFNRKLREDNTMTDPDFGAMAAYRLTGPTEMNLRGGAALSAAITGKVAVGAVVQRSAKAVKSAYDVYSWYRVTLQSGQTGYVANTSTWEAVTPAAPELMTLTAAQVEKLKALSAELAALVADAL